MWYKGATFSNFRLRIKLKRNYSDDDFLVLLRADGNETASEHYWPSNAYMYVPPRSGYQYNQLCESVAGIVTGLDSNSLAYPTGEFQAECLLYGSSISVATANSAGVLLDTLSASDSTRSSGYIGISAPEWVTERNPSFDALCVGKYVSPEPTHTSWGTEAAASTIVVPFDGRYAGDGSKQTTVNYSSASVIMQVESNFPNNLDRSAVIENLVIDGLETGGTTGILLENVYNCLIRNVTIKNCDVGIEVRITGSNWSHANRFEHIRMINVKTGILFTGTSTNKDFSYTTIDDVGISLTGDSNSVGIKVGDPYANLYSAFIKATVWLGSTSGKGMVVNGQLKFCLVNLEVEEAEAYSGYGVYISSGATVYDNQSFLLTALGLDSDKRLMNYGTLEPDGITVLPP
ncbi:MAG: hypothetical protein M1540_04125 [Candidatus Bathyarchaeota archaeon]|nr:hypothetical protein [Candidatus Bathyarchaeota archaeon]